MNTSKNLEIDTMNNCFFTMWRKCNHGSRSMKRREGNETLKGNNSDG
jgi:hypothetical protein